MDRANVLLIWARTERGIRRSRENRLTPFITLAGTLYSRLHIEKATESGEGH